MKLSVQLFAVMLLVSLLPYSLASIEVITTTLYRPESCLDIKQLRPKVHLNGYYTIYDKEEALHTVYCDFNSEKPYVWTLIESFSRKMGMYRSEEKGHYHFQRPFTTDYAYSECRPDNFQAYRTSLAARRLIYGSQTTTHWRATCNFDLYAMGIDKKMSHRDYVRGSMCSLNIMTLGSSGGSCYYADYMNIHGHSCSHCSMPFYASGSTHLSLISSQSPNRCGRIRFGHTVKNEYNWGTYVNYNEKFRCTATPESTTNWWLGGVYNAQDLQQNVKK
ncbi:hypothetical protein TrispH2_000462 [Trichoplax sp. H2]|uniref:Fibrinogen C-terminal domain-containing protein n=1 Tax=Trichoplax adhaerens TaxID=10228 RepID=B3S6P0_TRIAD|nr:predicted protein [Trichoplax adhaerens]EDV21790.1 predicted protein [Trichoplax adhaerens]RDD47333.1 hypothetical protein TrispH2_000462 [Trichoplax sp. H2]|eukprot:XP_002115938.1 predicted protein [Trichoplax adhaerens]